MDMTLDELIAIRKIQLPSVENDLSEDVGSKNTLYDKSIDNRGQDRSLVDYIDLDCLTDDDVSLASLKETDIVNRTTESNSSSNVIDLRGKITGNVSPLVHHRTRTWVLEQPSKRNPSKRKWGQHRRYRTYYGSSQQNISKNGDTGVRDLVIRVPSKDVNIHKSRTNFSKEANNQEISLLNSSISSRSNHSENLMNLFQLDDKTRRELMPVIADKFLKFLEKNENSVMHKPIYDMELQKEIHTLQNKTVRYTHKGQLVNSDGAGIEGCKVTPQASKLSMNYRFT